ncbi:MAG: hypothetical protein A3B99_00925 [Candidatus Yanofskybacteria bacterium RIFCSPHIGHO2_02_FULL_44_12b]|uniref:Nucleotidyl transferase domain-containing protein n=2 Tax=Candidatus Zambryskiibacteriota TaxID=1817925 RepID=A0A1G2T3I0_9BACT|nr:MAG: hypothetical protein A3B99_00925 [Candidatus Yanofskybacteria bacterium RIFCSPHIGHO2_02_FULL_44_12b]OHA91141.1 MAG: hypothetical protein A2758_01535 [Candidatus Zambryskibacteria bacterium RIFCSPHIGHO2_01_FULL_49_18]OHB05179.1 MAG: hypothetical protein A3A26_02665 [Candidatus Zambryskibacteria bacterium RIFCSPLOWO2_01_FULL_47_14]
MKAIILAGGEGTRLRPITYEIPKPLIPVKKRPLLNHAIDFLSTVGVDQIYVIISKEHNKDFQLWQKTWKGNIKIKPRFILEARPQGTFVALRKVKSFMKNGNFIVMNGDSLFDLNFSKIISFHTTNKNLATACLSRTNTKGNYIVPAVATDRKIKSMKRKTVNPGTTYICCGLYIFNSKIFSHDNHKKNFLDIESGIFPGLIKNKELFGYKTSGRFFDCGTLESWTKAIFMW